MSLPKLNASVDVSTFLASPALSDMRTNFGVTEFASGMLEVSDASAAQSLLGTPALLDARVVILSEPPQSNSIGVLISGNPSKGRQIAISGELGYDGSFYTILSNYMLTENSLNSGYFTDNDTWSYETTSNTLTNTLGGTWISGNPECNSRTCRISGSIKRTSREET